MAPPRSWQLDALFDEIAADPSWGTARVTRILVKTPELRQILVAMPAGSEWAEHRAAGRVSVCVIRGRIAFGVGGESTELAAGTLAAVEPGVLHDVRALEPSAFLLTVAGPEPGN